MYIKIDTCVYYFSFEYYLLPDMKLPSAYSFPFFKRYADGGLSAYLYSDMNAKFAVNFQRFREIAVDASQE
jgi:hypothetical protein